MQQLLHFYRLEALKIVTLKRHFCWMSLCIPCFVLQMFGSSFFMAFSSQQWRSYLRVPLFSFACFVSFRFFGRAVLSGTAHTRRIPVDWGQGPKSTPRAFRRAFFPAAKQHCFWFNDFYGLQLSPMKALKAVFCECPYKFNGLYGLQLSTMWISKAVFLRTSL